MIAAAPPSLPRWDVSSVYSGLDGDDYRSAFARLDGDIAALDQFFDDRGVRRLSSVPRPDDGLSQTLVTAVQRMSDVFLQYETLEAFIHAFYSTNSFDEVASRETSRLEAVDTRRKR